MNKIALEGFLQRVEGLSIADLKTVRAEFVKHIVKGERFLGDSDTDLAAVGAIDQLVSLKERDLAESGLTPEQLHERDKEQLQKIGGVGAKMAARYLKNNGSPWSGARKHREVAQPAPAIEQPVRAPSRREAVEADEANSRQEQLRK